MRFETLLIATLTSLMTIVPGALAQGPLPTAMRSATPTEAQELLAAGVDLEQRDGQGNTSLMAAVMFNPDIAVAELLLQAGANTEARTGTGSTVLHLAVRRSAALDRLLLLLQAGADPVARDGNGETVLMSAASHASSPAVLRELIIAGAEVDARDSRGASATHYAAESSVDPNALRVLIEAGAAIDARDREGRTPLMLASMAAGKLDMIRFLLSAGAQVDATDATGRTPLMYAAAHNPDQRLVQEFVSAGATLELTDSAGRTALMHAAEASMDPSVVGLLLDVGADAAARSDRGEFPADFALRNQTLRGTDIYDRLRTAAEIREQALFRDFRRLQTPIAVVVALDVHGSVQGIGAASQVYEMPISPDRSGLMLAFSDGIPERIGPVDPAEAQFVDLARVLDALIVHDCGSPGAHALLGNTPSLDAHESGEPFERRSESADGSLFAVGDLLRQVHQEVPLVTWIESCDSSGSWFHSTNWTSRMLRFGRLR